jgi:hypothetical protein
MCEMSVAIWWCGANGVKTVENGARESGANVVARRVDVELVILRHSHGVMMVVVWRKILELAVKCAVGSVVMRIGIKVYVNG